MNQTKKAATEKAKNYSDEQVKHLQGMDTVSYQDAVDLAEEWGKSLRSIISKVISLDLTYIPKPKPEKKIAKETKAELVAQIESETGASLDGLEKATVKALVNLLEAVSS